MSDLAPFSPEWLDDLLERWRLSLNNPANKQTRNQLRRVINDQPRYCCYGLLLEESHLGHWEGNDYIVDDPTHLDKIINTNNRSLTADQSLKGVGYKELPHVLACALIPHLIPQDLSQANDLGRSFQSIDREIGALLAANERKEK